MDPANALQAVETSLRLVIRDVLGEGWRDVLGDMAPFEAKRTVDQERRDGAVVSDDLLSYVEFHHLSKIIQKKWDPHFHPVFGDRKRTDVWLDVLEDVRNAIAHSRELLEFERDLVSGISGQLRNQVTMFRTSKNPTTAHYPVIESVVDSFGLVGVQNELLPARTPQRLEVGDVLSFTCRGSDERGREIEWLIETDVDRSKVFPIPRIPIETQRGATVTLEWVVTEDHVSEAQTVHIKMRSADSRFRLNKPGMLNHEPFDDWRGFFYAINPPME